MKFLTSIFGSLVVFALLLSCNGVDDTTSSDPSNLSAEIIEIDSSSFKVSIQASADNTIRYDILLEETEILSTNTDGYFEYTFAEATTYTVEVRAYGESGRYISETLQVVLKDETISINDGYFTQTEYEGYTLVWQDEFNGTSINTSDWTFETGASGWGNNEWQYYRSENASVDGETLIIEAKNQSYSGSDYTSARMITKGNQSFKYGRIDARALLPEGQGIWPAIWMLGSNFSTVGWPACGEIDIMEMIGGQNRENTTHGTLHWEYLSEHASTGGQKTLSDETFNDKYHVFTIIWDESSINWLVDDQEYNSIDISPDHMSEFHEEFFFIFNLAVGGNWPGYPDETTSFPQQMKVDYIRVFQK